MKIGIWLNSDYSPEVGGGYSYYSRLIDGIDNYFFSNDIDLYYITEGANTPNLHRPIIHLSYSPEPLLIKERILRKLPLFRHKVKQAIKQRNEQNKINQYTKALQSNGIKLIYYPIPYLCPLPDFPFVITHWDIGHRSTFAFPEVVGKDAFLEREIFYNNIIPKALLIFCESESGKNELNGLSLINESRIRVVNLFAGSSLSSFVAPQKQQDLLNNYGIFKEKYFYYPAQFWAHKNHYTLLKAFIIFKREFQDYKLVFSGADNGNQKYIKHTVEQLGLTDNVVFTGFISNEAVNALYRNAIALIMPTLMGPTNMPLLEAMELGCPVICSDLPGHREELGDAAIYINPMSAEDISLAMKTMIRKREDYVKRIIEQRKNTIFSLDNALKAINTHLLDATAIRECWE